MIKNINASKRYMKLGNFWKDPHNKEMEELTKEFIAQRDLLTNISKTYSKDYFQTNEGGLHSIKRRGFFAFLQGPSIFMRKYIDNAVNDYDCLRDEIVLKAQEARKEFTK